MNEETKKLLKKELELLNRIIEKIKRKAEKPSSREVS